MNTLQEFSVMFHSRRGFRSHWFIVAFGAVVLNLPTLLGAAITPMYALTNQFNASTLYKGSGGTFFGTLNDSTGSGSLFQLSSDGEFSVVADFVNQSVGSPFQGGPLIQDREGNFYGTANGGGSFGIGTVYRVTDGAINPLVSFNGTNGAYPTAGLIVGPDGNYYGTTSYGGALYRPGIAIRYPGTIFRFGTNGILTTLVSFDRTNGASPAAPLLLGTDGRLYGTTIAGGSNDLGTIFCVTTNGELTSLVTFDGVNGAHPYGVLVQTGDGTFYGTTSHGGANNLGTVFQLSRNGQLTTLVSFYGVRGAYPYSGLVRGYDGKFYGTTTTGGLGFDATSGSGSGTVFGVTTNGSFSVLGEFTESDGFHPVTDLVQGEDGFLYGCALLGGAYESGSLFRVEIPIEIKVNFGTDGILNLSWNALPGRDYQIRFLDKINSPADWKDLGTVVAATGDTCSVTQAMETDTPRFFQVILRP